MKKMNATRNRKLSQSVKLGALAAGLVLALSACNPQAYVTNAVCTGQKSPGTFKVQPKVDLLLVEDDTGSISEAYSQIASQVPGFLSGLESKGWDYHFATLPLTTQRPIKQIMASKFDPNWTLYGLWQQPFPGADPNNVSGYVDPSYFATPEQYVEFLTPQNINNSLNGLEPGFQNIANSISAGLGGGFMRSDALFVMFVIGNGNDTSGVTMCKRSDGFVGPCDLVGHPDNSMYTSFMNYLSFFQGTKPDPKQVKFYAAVAASSSRNCLGGYSYVGTRYQQMAAALGGQSYDICSQPLSNVLDGLSQNLQAQEVGFRTRYLFIEHEPDVSSIVVTKNDGGCGPGTPIPQDPNNGWTYAGYLTDAPRIDYPVTMDNATGYAIELHGSAKLVGNQVASVRYRIYGTQDTVSQ